MLKPSQKPKKKRSAQAMVEFALALPVLLLVVYGLLETGRLLFLYASVVTSARQAARYGSATGDNGSGINYYNDCPGIRRSAEQLGFIQRINDADVLISYDDGTSPLVPSTCPITASGHPINGDRITVTVSSRFTPIVPLIVPLTSFVITSTSSRTLLIGIPIAVDTPVGGFPPGGGGGLISISKIASPTTYQKVGDVITYTYAAGNPGSDSIYGVGITDDKTTVSCPASIGTTPLVTSGVTPNCTSTYTITQADIDAGSVTNTATASAVTSGGTPLTASISKTVTFVSAPSISLDKVGTAPDVVDVGKLVTYQFTIKNTGNVPLTAYAITDTLLNNGVSCPSTPSPLLPGVQVVCTGSYALKNADISNSGGSISNTATATAKYGATIVSATATAITKVPILQLTSVTGSPNPVTTVGQVVTYTYSFKNRGTNTLSSFSITDSKLGTFACPGTLAPQTSTTCQHTYTTVSADFEAGLISTTSTVSGSAGPKTWVSNAYASTVGVTQVIKLVVTKTGSPLTPAPATAFTVGQVITYKYSLQNTGNVTLKGPYTVTDDKLGAITCPAGDLAVGGAAVGCTDKTYALTQADLDAGSVINTVTAAALTKVTSQPATATPATVTVITYTGARFGLVKTSTPTFFTASGQDIVYTYKLRNTGGVPLTVNSPYVLTDDKIGTITCGAGASGPLAVGASVLCKSAHYTTSAGDVTAKSVVNTVVASGASTTTPATGSPSTSLTVPLYVCNNTTLLSGGPIPPGQDVNWTIINNTGFPVHISSLVISWSGTARLVQVILDSISIWTGSSPSSITVPGAPWTLNTGSTVMNLKFSAPANATQAVLSFSETSCAFSLMSSP